MNWRFHLLPAIALALGACATVAEPSAQSAASPVKALPARVSYPKDPFPSTYKPMPSEDVLIRNATVFDGLGGEIKNGAVLIQGGKIVAVGAEAAMTLPAGIKTIDASGKWVTPGIIDIHSHLGVYPSPGISAHQDGNEISGAVTAEVWAEHGLWPQDPGFTRAMAGGITAMEILPGSANLFGGRGVIIKAVPSRTAQGMKFPGAPYTLKMACGENPKRVYGYGNGGDGAGGKPYSRMGNVAGYREAWQNATEYKRKWTSTTQNSTHGKRKPSLPIPRTPASRTTRATSRRSAGCAGPQPATRYADGRPQRRNPGPAALLSRRRDGADHRSVEGVRLQGLRIPSWRRSVQDR